MKVQDDLSTIKKFVLETNECVQNFDKNLKTYHDIAWISAETNVVVVDEEIMSNNADQQIDIDGNTLLHFAVAQKRPEDVKLMLQEGTQTYLKNNAGRTPFHQAAGESTLEIVKLLYFNDNQTNLRDEEGSTPLHYAVENGKLDVATFLFQNGASLNLKDSSGRTPLHYAAKLKINPRERENLPSSRCQSPKYENGFLH